MMINQKNNPNSTYFRQNRSSFMQGANLSRHIRMLEREAAAYVKEADRIHAECGGYTLEEGQKLRKALLLRENILEICRDEEQMHQDKQCEQLRTRLRACKGAVAPQQTGNTVSGTAGKGGVEPTAFSGLSGSKAAAVSGTGAAGAVRGVTGAVSAAGTTGAAGGMAGAAGGVTGGMAGAATGAPGAVSGGMSGEESKYDELIYSFFQKAPDVTLDDYIGKEELLEKIRMLFNEDDREVQNYLELMANNCICLVGPPGTGKTFLYTCIAGSKMQENPEYKFICISAGALVSKYSGETEKNIAALFRVAEQNAPCLLVLEEAERLLMDKTDDSASGHEKRMVSEFQLACDKILKSDKGITFLCCTNYPEQCEAAMLSRFTTFEVPYPSRAERRKAFAKHLHMMKLDDSISYDVMADETAEFSYRDIRKMTDSMKYAVMSIARSSYPDASQKLHAVQNGEIRISREIFDRAWKENKPLDLEQRLEKAQEKAEKEELHAVQDGDDRTSKESFSRVRKGNYTPDIARRLEKALEEAEKEEAEQKDEKAKEES